MLAWSCALALCAPQDARRAAQVSVLDLGAGRILRDALEGDLDGDGASDLALAVSREGATRQILVLRARDQPGSPPFAVPPDASIDLTPDVVAWALGDVDASSRGAELVLFSARGAFVCRPFAPAEQRFGRLVECDFLWQLADAEVAFAHPAAVVDLDRDGAVDLVLPEPGGYAVARQVRGATGSSFPVLARLRVPSELAPQDGSRSRFGDVALSRGADSNSLDVSFGAARSRSSTLLSVFDSAPVPQLLDFDGDGRLDVQAQGVRALWIWQQAADGSFPTSPQRSYPLPVPADRDRRLDASYSSHVIDADGDGRSDVAIFAGDRRSEDVRTQLLLFVQGKGRGDAAKSAEAPLFGPKGLPQQLLVLGGFAAGAYFDDLDLDGKPELFVRTVRPDLIDQLRSASSESLDAEVLVYRNENGEWARKPTLAWRVSVPIKDFDLTLRFVGDLDGDRLADLVERAAPERLRVRAMRRAKEGWQIDSKPRYETAVAADARILLVPRHDRPASDIAVVEGSQVLWVRFP